MNIRNAKYLSADGSIIECEIEHPRFGWIPFTAKSSDSASLFVFNRRNTGTLTVDPYVEPAPIVTVPDKVTRRQFIQELIDMEIDGSVEAALNAIPGVKDRKMMWAWYNESQFFERNRPEIMQIASALGYTNSDVDDMFIRAAQR